MNAETKFPLLLPNAEATAKTLAAILAKDVERGLLTLIEDGHEREARAVHEIVSASSWSASWNTLFWGFVKAWRAYREEYSADMDMWSRREARHDAFLRSRGIDPDEESEFHFREMIKGMVALRAASE